MKTSRKLLDACRQGRPLLPSDPAPKPGRSFLSFGRKCLFSLGLAVALPCSGVLAATYYVDSVAGLDTNNGTTTATPWKTLTKVNSVHFVAGDQVLFKRGSAWTGTLSPDGVGTPTDRVVFDAYGTGPNPIINGAGATNAVALWDKHHFTLQNFEITNDAATWSPRNGIYLGYAAVSGTFSDVQILNNVIHNVKGSAVRTNMYNNAAIYIEIAENSTLVHLDGLVIQGNDTYDNGSIGIMQKAPPYYDSHPECWATNEVIRDNSFARTGADHIVIMGATAPLIEYNAGYDLGAIGSSGYGWSAGMWSSYYCTDATFQFNEVARTRNEKAPNDGDSQAFDCDLGTYGTHLFQYNYSHDNVGGVLIMMYEAKPKTVIYRYNLSVNDDRQTNSGSQLPVYPVTGTNSAYIYNNVFYTTLASGYKLLDYRGTYYYNNIFYTPLGTYPSHPVFSNNCYFGHVPEVTDPYKVVADPKFVGPLPTLSGSDGFGPGSTDLFKLQSSSPCINAGVAVVDNGGRDFFGNALYSGTYADIGMHEVVGGNTPPPGVVTFTDDAPGSTVIYSGAGWTHGSDIDSINSTQSVSQTVGDSVSFTFSGTNVTLGGKRGVAKGKLNVSIDGGAPVLVDCYWPVELVRQEIFQATGLTSGSHTLVATVATKNQASGGNYIGLDYFEQMPGTPLANPVFTTVDDPASSVVVYSSGWTASTGNSGMYAGTRTLSSTVGSYVDFNFTGTGVRIFGTKYSNYGKLSVSIDGGAATVINCFDPGLYALNAAKLYEVNGLTSGTHTLRATIATKDPLSAGNYVAIDCFQALVGGTGPADVIMDNADPTGVATTGTWYTSTSTPGYYGSNYIHDGNTGQATKSIRFTPTLPVAGSYQVFAWWTAYSNRATNVPIDIVSASGTTTVQVNQQATGGQWVLLGTFYFDAGTSGSVQIRNTATNGFVIADAVRFLKP